MTNPQNQKPDIAATEAFCVMLTKEAEGVQIGTKLLAMHIQSLDEKEALQALAVRYFSIHLFQFGTRLAKATRYLQLLDTCMKRCGPTFHAEIGKFRFLNEMIKLVSPKYLGSHTAASVRQKVSQLLCSWMKEYPRETKIKEAYEMLKKQGVIEVALYHKFSSHFSTQMLPSFCLIRRKCFSEFFQQLFRQELAQTWKKKKEIRGRAYKYFHNFLYLLSAFLVTLEFTHKCLPVTKSRRSRYITSHRRYSETFYKRSVYINL